MEPINTPDPASCSGNGVDHTTYDYSDNVAASASPPGGLTPQQIPMLVTIGWDDNGYSGLEGSGGTGAMKWATDMIAARANPDGSPVRMTFYLTSLYGNSWVRESPTYVKRAWRTALEGGNEIGNHTATHSHGSAFTLEQWKSEIDKCSNTIAQPFDPNESTTSPSAKAGIGIAPEQIYGFRVPFLEYNDAAFQAIQSRGLWYDCSIEDGFQYNQDGTNFNFPYTLDNGSPGHDVAVEWMLKDPISPRPGLWELPVHPVIAPPDEVAAEYGIQPGLRAKLQALHSWFDVGSGKITGTDYNLWVHFQLTPAEFLATLKYTLDLRLQGNRAPFMFGAHTDYYSNKYTSAKSATVEERQRAIEDFIDYALSKPEVRVVTMKEILDWMRDPKPLGCE